MCLYVYFLCLYGRYDISAGGGDILGTKKPKIGTKNNNVVDRERGACKKKCYF